jgi:5'-nucleotidase
VPPFRTSALLGTALAASLLAACTTTHGAQTAAVQGPVELQVIALNDFHGNLETPSSTVTYRQGEELVREQLGGAARLGATLTTLRQGHAQTITVAAGDLIGGSPFVSANFLDEPSIAALGMAGLDVASVGNHEFDRGTGELRRVQNGGCEKFTLRQPCALEPFAGAAFTYLAGNVVDAAGHSLFPGTFIRQMGPAKIGFIGLTTKDTATLVSPSGTTGFSFLDEAETANRLAAELRAQGADAVVLLIHEGGRTDPTQNLSGCPGLNGAIVPIVERLDPSISLVVSGHTHMSYVCRVEAAGAPPRLLTSAGRFGSFVTDIRVTWDPATRRVIDLSAINVPVNDAAGAQPDLAALVQRYTAAAAPIAARVVGTVTPFPSGGEDCPDTPDANLVADAQLAAARAAMGGRVDVAFINTSGVRSGLSGAAADGQLTYGELFTIQPFGNTLVVLEMTGAQLRETLEEQFCGEGPARSCFTMLAPSANFTYSYDRSRPRGGRVVEAALDGQPIDPARTYRAVFNNFLASGGDGFTSLGQRRSVGEAGVDLDALEAWIAPGATIPACGRLQDLTPA